MTQPSGKPNLAQYNQSLRHYTSQYEDAIAVLNSAQLGDATEAYHQRVEATWGLIAKGSAAIPFALEMLKSKYADTREDAGGILGELGGDESVVTDLLAQLEQESDNQARDSIILALGQLRSRAAIPTLHAIISNTEEDGDTRWTAIESLGRIVRRRFLKQADPEQAAMDWLAKHAADS